MNTAADTFTEDQAVTVMAAPGYPTGLQLIVIAVGPRMIAAVREHGEPVEYFTLRRNGRFARKGAGQWSGYLRAVA